MAPTRQVQLCLRPFTPSEVQHRQQEAIDRLNNIAARGGPDVDVVWWSPRVCPPDTDNPLAAGCPPVVAELLDLAARADVSLDPHVEDTARPGGDDSFGLPDTCLVIREGEQIGGLYPATVGTTSYTVEDGLHAMETGGSALNLA